MGDQESTFGDNGGMVIDNANIDCQNGGLGVELSMELRGSDPHGGSTPGEV